KAEQVSTDWAYEWKLTNKADFSRASVALQQVDPRQATRGWQDGKTAWELPGNAWTLPLLLRSVTSTDEGARVRIPVIFKNNANNRCGAFINIRFETPFPGPIPMLPQTRELAGMDNGSDFVPLGSGE
ncbi:MAG: hypothetical protein IID33_14370, partial [Planctomycetes bacterium]|nr:hypothetical protein [Planctomycetota bacterium]